MKIYIFIDKKLFFRSSLLSKLFLIFNQFAYLRSTACFDPSPPGLNQGTCFIFGQPKIKNKKPEMFLKE